MSTEKREQRKWWAVTGEHDVRLVTGFSCAPDNRDYWWVPKLGFSMLPGKHLFNTEREAKEAALAELLKSIADKAKHLKLLNQKIATYKRGIETTGRRIKRVKKGVKS